MLLFVRDACALELGEDAKLRRAEVRIGRRSAAAGRRPFAAPLIQLHEEDIGIAKNGEIEVS